jgi:GT2 family glycosyltransferase
MSQNDIPAKCNAVIIVNYGTAALTIVGVESVLHYVTDRDDVQIHVVDNASPRDDAATPTAAHKAGQWGERVRLYLKAENHGFWRGNNLVLRALSETAGPADRMLLLNPDAWLENDVISLMGAVLDTHPQVGMVGAGISKPDGTAVTAAFRFPNIADTFATQLNFGPVSRLLRARLVPLPPDHSQGRVDWVAGAAVMCRMQAMRDVNFFDPAFFLYFEEVDLLRQAHLHGWLTWYWPTARVIHAEGAATGVKSGVSERRRRPAYWYQS